MPHDDSSLVRLEGKYETAAPGQYARFRVVDHIGQCIDIQERLRDCSISEGIRCSGICIMAVH